MHTTSFNPNLGLSIPNFCHGPNILVAIYFLEMILLGEIQRFSRGCSLQEHDITIMWSAHSVRSMSANSLITSCRNLKTFGNMIQIGHYGGSHVLEQTVSRHKNSWNFSAQPEIQIEQVDQHNKNKGQREGTHNRAVQNISMHGFHFGWANRLTRKKLTSKRQLILKNISICLTSISNMT